MDRNIMFFGNDVTCMAGTLSKTGSFLSAALLCGIITLCGSAPLWAQTLSAAAPAASINENDLSPPIPLKVTIPDLKAVEEQGHFPDVQPINSQLPANSQAPPRPPDKSNIEEATSQKNTDLSSSINELASKLLSQFLPQEYRTQVAISPEIILALNQITPVVSADGDSVTIHSDGIVIKKEIEHLSQEPPPTEGEEQTAATEPLAALSPAAGGDAPADNSAATLPLITVPEVPTTVEAPPEPAAIDIKPEDIQPLLDAAPAAPPVAEPPPAPPSNIKPADIMPLIDAPVQASTPTDAPKETPTEPKRELSEASKKIIGKVPAHIDRPRNDHPSPFAIDHAKDTPELDAEAPASAKHEAVGIKIEVKAPRFDANYELGRAYDAMLSGQNNEAIELYKLVLDNDPNNKNALFGLATMYHRAGQLELARPLYARLLAIDPNDRDGLNNFLVLLGDEAPEAALPQMEKLEARNPNFSPIPAQMAVIYEKLGDMDKASEKMFTAIRLAPENLTYRYNLAIMLDKQKKYDEAAELYRQIIEAYQKGSVIPGNLEKIQQRLTFISSNRH